MSEVTDILLLIRKYCIIKKLKADIPLLIRKYRIIKKEEGKSQTGHWADSMHAFLVSSVTRETLTYDVT